jgi:hypothetical protein
VSFAFCCGLGPIPWAYSSELFPPDLRLELGCPFFASDKKMRNEAKKMQKQTQRR